MEVIFIKSVLVRCDFSDQLAIFIDMSDPAAKCGSIFNEVDGTVGFKEPS
jgi:hypothetical protein